MRRGGDQTQAPLGGGCGESETCQDRVPDPFAPGSFHHNPWWPDCLADQCLEGPCVGGACSRKCTIHKDDMDNATGAPGPDGIEDPDTPASDCADAIPDVFPGGFSCVRVIPVDLGDAAFCLPRSSYLDCEGPSGCPPGESCGYVPVLGDLTRPRCVASPAGSGGLAAPCGWDPIAGGTRRCASWACSQVEGCSAACAADADCLTAAADCVDGRCAAGGRACGADEDCSAWTCADALLIEDMEDAFRACAPRTCSSDADCADPAFYCRWRAKMGGFGAYEPAGLCAPRTPGGEPLGATCDDTPGDGVPDTVCENRAYCLDKRCSAACASDADCGGEGSGMRCGMREVPIDAEMDGSADAVREVALCLWMGGPGTVCASRTGCAGGLACTPWVPAGAAAGEAPLLACMAPPQGSAGIGTPCGEAAWGQGCDARACIGERPEDGLPGWCSAPCGGASDCPGPGSIGPDLVKWICDAVRFSGAGTDDRLDDRWTSWCVPVHADSSLSDCAATVACADAAEFCRLSIAFDGGVPAGSYACVRPDGGLPVGAACDPDGDGTDCATGSCMRTMVPGLGFCTRPCLADPDCALVTGGASTCIERHGPGGFGVRECGIAGECVTCRDGLDCGAGQACADVSGIMGIEDWRCVTACEGDQECTAPGAFCVEPMGVAGGPADVPVKVCLPAPCAPAF
ncbi:MAG: hypothetical protein FJ087_18005 [Deltaproteobacteria bacterium]|nr:hypothetical protein [Deltaproteobacteria bacterium]